MNLINCSADCRYQKDGICCLDALSSVAPQAKEGCHHYRKIELPESQSPEFAGQPQPLHENYWKKQNN